MAWLNVKEVYHVNYMTEISTFDLKSSLLSYFLILIGRLSRFYDV